MNCTIEGVGIFEQFVFGFGFFALVVIGFMVLVFGSLFIMRWISVINKLHEEQKEVRK